MNTRLTTGTLALVGSGEYLPDMDPVDRLLLDRVGTSPRVVCLPTAAGTEGDATVARWAKMGIEHFSRLGAAVEAVNVIDRRTANDDAYADKIRAANFVYLSGGKPEYLHKSLDGTRTWDAIVDLLTRGGVVAGCSAGAMVWGGRIPSFPTILPWHKAFDYLPKTVIMPHYDEFGDRWGGMLKPLMGNSTLLGVDGYTALIYADGGFTAQGRGAVTVWNRNKTRFNGGQPVSW
jgi:cyanophycinase